MKKIACTLTACLSILIASGQQKPQYTQYILNNYILNPALSGIYNYTDVKLSYRSQWTGLKGAPVTDYFSIQGPIGKKDYKTIATSFQVPGQNPRGTYYGENSTPSKPHHGVGLFILNDKTGLYNRFSADASYAYHMGLSARINLAVGFAAGITNISYDLSRVNFAEPGDPVVSGGNGHTLNSLRPDLSAGLWLYSTDYFVGLSAQQIIPQQYTFSGKPALEKATLIPHFFATAGYGFQLSDDIKVTPSVMFKYVQGTPTVPQFDFNIKFQYLDLLWAGGSYRYQDGYSAMVGFNVGNTFNLGYAYDFTTSHLNTVSGGTHEIIIGLLIGNHYSEKCPVPLW
jgi:type IX secretion system PorP/SprF family membrane protein